LYFIPAAVVGAAIPYALAWLEIIQGLTQKEILMKYATILATAAALTLGGLGAANADEWQPRTQAEQYQVPPGKTMTRNMRAEQARAEVVSNTGVPSEAVVGAGAILAVALLLAL
jgi:hypothetical protein